MPGDSTAGTFTYDAAKRPTGFARTGSLALSFSQAYDRVGNVTSEGRSLTGVSGTAGSGTFTYTYDALRRLTGASLAGTSQSYTYDLDGNRLTATRGGVTTTYTYDATDQLIEPTTARTHVGGGSDRPGRRSRRRWARGRRWCRSGRACRSFE